MLAMIMTMNTIGAITSMMMAKISSRRSFRLCLSISSTISSGRIAFIFEPPEPGVDDRRLALVKSIGTTAAFFGEIDIATTENQQLVGYGQPDSDSLSQILYISCTEWQIFYVSYTE